jgi:hypothetical protein
MKKKIIVFSMAAILAFIPVKLLGEGMTIGGGKDAAEKNFSQVQEDVEAGRDERDRNTMEPLVPVVEFIGEALREGQAFLNSPARSGSKAVLYCNDTRSGLAVACSTTETNQRCMDRVQEHVRDMGYDDGYDYCKIPNPDRHESIWASDYITRSDNVRIE